MTRYDSYADVEFSDLDPSPERQGPVLGALNCTFEIFFPELIFYGYTYGLPLGGTKQFIQPYTTRTLEVPHPCSGVVYTSVVMLVVMYLQPTFTQKSTVNDMAAVYNFWSFALDDFVMEKMFVTHHKV